MEGILSDSETHHGKPYQDSQCQGLKFQPFFLPGQNARNLEFIGKGLIKRGIYSKGFPTPTNINSICSCDQCRKSFTLKHFNSSQPHIDYFYASGNRTLVASHGKLGKTPEEIDEKLRATGWEDFSFFNPFKCPHCSSIFIDFEMKKSLKEEEIYGNYLLNSNILYWKKLK
ncbi:hypothetical protein NAEGRDRAFT_63499 [Naegleria gruberi]|uniref:Uncharacterized protein n=1 Tax=Naegleria gruberi TaxID=5762 RepID=D2V3V1_NAEGR|nr:uncharacterized protein NAEGRDRAFT_63499 [Naegleria gruberi]EFC48421.1 hypothetical protein NAEGRDRAFT_63499 [Naegleria gruberi]|eukprot:XP_002681165.1 hypothetical protein NAEGRDRAFT_63499 [Naegleria gruberi strain NEG-M]